MMPPIDGGDSIALDDLRHGPYFDGKSANGDKLGEMKLDSSHRDGR